MKRHQYSLLYIAPLIRLNQLDFLELDVQVYTKDYKRIRHNFVAFYYFDINATSGTSNKIILPDAGVILRRV